PAWIATIADDANFPRAALAARLGLQSAMAFPIMLGGNVLGVLEFFTTEHRVPDQDTLALVQAVGHQLGHCLERANMQSALKQSNAELEHFASMSSHDLQEPLRTVISFTELLR